MLLHEYIEHYARDYPNAPCVEMGEVTFNYGDANQRCNALAHAMVKSPMVHGDRLAWISKNCLDQIFVFYAASKVGVVPTPLNYRLAPPELAYIINDSQDKVLVCEEEFTPAIDAVREQLLSVEAFICLDGHPEGWTPMENWVDGAATTNPQHTITEDDVLYQMYTSGTTGLPKGVLISQRCVSENSRTIGVAMGLPVLKSRLLLVTPLYHAAAGMFQKTAITHGGSIVLHREFDPLATVNDLATKDITNGGMVPAMVQACLVAVPDLAEREYPALQTMTYGASPIAEETLRQAMAGFKGDFNQIFGMTETTGCAITLSQEDHRRALNGEPHLLLSCGRAALGTDVRIVDEDGVEVEPNVVGEIVVRGPQNMLGYWNLEEATANTLKDGWLYTGDAARMDEEGFVYIEDRIKDMIVTGAENVYPKEIENALFEPPNIADAAVIGIPSEKWGEAILAFIVTRDGADIPVSEVTAFCRERLAGYKVPREVEFIADIPRNPTGKILKNELREPYWKAVERRVG